MGERINVGYGASALSAGFRAGGQAFASSLARSAARDRADRALARVEDRAYRDAAATLATRDLRSILGL